MKSEVATYTDSAVEDVLRALVRRVDKKLEYAVCAGAEPASVVLNLRHGKLSRQLQIPLAVIEETRESLGERERLRVRIKRARDLMLASVKRIPVQSSRAARAVPSDIGSFFRAGGGRGGPR